MFLVNFLLLLLTLTFLSVMLWLFKLHVDIDKDYQEAHEKLEKFIRGKR